MLMILLLACSGMAGLPDTGADTGDTAVDLIECCELWCGESRIGLVESDSLTWADCEMMSGQECQPGVTSTASEC